MAMTKQATESGANGVRATLTATVEASRKGVRLAVFEIARCHDDWAFTCRECAARVIRPSMGDLGRAMASHALEHAL